MNMALLAQIESSLLPPTRFVGDQERWTLEERMQYHAVPGVSFAVFDAGAPVAVGAYGIRSRPDGAAVDPSTRFQAASMSKVVTALLVMQQVDAGRVTLDEDVNDKLRSWRVPESPLSAARPVTLRRILTHRAGLTVHGFRGYPRGVALPSVIEVLNGRDGITGPVCVDIAPDSQQRYSGGGTTVAQLLLEDVTGQSFAQLAQQCIFAPLQLQRTTFEQLVDDVADNVAVGHRPDGSRVQGGWHRFVQLGAAGLWTTAIEFGRILAEVHRAWCGRSTLLSQCSAREMLSRPYGDQRGLGPMVYGDEDNPRFFHDGDNQGYHCGATFYAGSGQGAVVMTNGDLGPALWREVFGAIAQACGWRGYLESPLEVYSITSTELARYAGEYRITAGYEAAATISVRVVDGALEGGIDGIPARTLLPISKTDFRSRATPFTTRFEFDSNDRVTGVCILEGEDVLIKATRPTT